MKWWVVPCLMLGACAKNAPLARAEAECTLATPLVPGVPGSPGHFIPSELNPNGASELAALMRQMVGDLEQARAAIEGGGRPPPLWHRHQKMRCAWPTEPAERTPQFDALAVSYLAQLRALEGGAADPREAYARVVQACIACHQTTCEGPIARIEKLQWSPP